MYTDETTCLHNLEDIYQLIASFFTPNQLIGVELETTLFNCSGTFPKRVDFQFLKQLFEKFEKNGWQWSPLAEFIEHVELKKNHENISLERGGQLEYASYPCHTVKELELYLNHFIDELKSFLPPQHICSTLSFDPITKPEDIPIIPKKRYDFLESYLGNWVKQMLRGTTSIQFNFDYASETDLMKKLTVVTTFQPLFASLCFSSAIFEGKKTKHKSYRSFVWNQIDPIRRGSCFASKKQPQTLESYIHHILKVPMVFLKREGQYFDAKGSSFSDFMEGKLKIFEDQYPLKEDFLTFVGTTYPDIRLKKTLELRGHDSVPRTYIYALSALWMGILYDKDSLDEAYNMALSVDFETLQLWREKLIYWVCEKQENAFLKRLYACAENGLRRRNFGEGNKLLPLKECIFEQRFLANDIKKDFETMQLTDFMKKWSH